MAISSYVLLSRQSGLMREMDTIANNIANGSTTGFRQRGVTYSEFVRALNGESTAFTDAGTENISFRQGELIETGGEFDLAIEGDGFFQLETPQGPVLTRNGAFSLNAVGELVSADGWRVLDAGGSPIIIPLSGEQTMIAPDGTISQDGQFIGQIAVFNVTQPAQFDSIGSSAFRYDQDPLPALDARISQRHLEGSNVDLVLQFARMIEVQRAYELGQSMLRMDQDRLKNTIQTLMS